MVMPQKPDKAKLLPPLPTPPPRTTGKMIGPVGASGEQVKPSHWPRVTNVWGQKWRRGCTLDVHTGGLVRVATRQTHVDGEHADRICFSESEGGWNG